MSRAHCPKAAPDRTLGNYETWEKPNTGATATARATAPRDRLTTDLSLQALC